jgi:hypothetical protein
VRDERHPSAERGNVRGSIGRATQHAPGVVDPDDRDRRLGRDAAAVARQVLVEDGVAEDENALAGEGRDKGYEI